MEGLAGELHGNGRPGAGARSGFSRTEFTSGSRAGGAENRFAWMSAGSRRDNPCGASPRRVDRLYPGFRYRLLIGLLRLVPRRLIHWVIRGVDRLRPESYWDGLSRPQILPGPSEGTGLCLIILSHFRITGWAVGIGLLLAGCSGDDLLLPLTSSPCSAPFPATDRPEPPATRCSGLSWSKLSTAWAVRSGARRSFSSSWARRGSRFSDSDTERRAGPASAEVRLGLTVGDQPVDARLGDASDLESSRDHSPRPDGGGNGDGDGDGNGKGKGKGHGGDGDDDD